MATLESKLKELIRKIEYPLLPEDRLKVILKSKLTKKEYKILFGWIKDTEATQIQHSLNITPQKYEELSQKIVKKLNYDSLKQAIYDK